MACSLALSFYSTSPPAGHRATGNVTVTNEGASDVTLTSLELYMATRQGFRSVQVATGSGASYAGTNGPGETIVASGTKTYGFDFVAVGGTLVAAAVVSDGSNPTATQSITPT